jgi:CheY-like chemotaxis protein
MARLSILLVDDSYDILVRLSDMLTELNIASEIRTALNYNEALEHFNTHVPDLVLLDIHLPGKNGIELLRYIKHSGKPCCVMMLSNYANEYYRAICINAGADYFFDKTKDFMLIPEAIKNLAST